MRTARCASTRGRKGRKRATGEAAEYEVEATFEERVIDVATDYETMIAECVSELGLPP